MLISRGSKGDAVRKIQNRLGITVDGDFGAKTETAVKVFQLRNKLKVDGVVGDDTWIRMFPNEEPIKETVVIQPIGDLNFQKLQGAIPDFVISQIPDTISKFGINTNLRLAHFLSQCAHESINFSATVENLNYSKDALLRVFRRYFPGNLAESYKNNPEKIGSRVYGGRMGNGPESTKEGFKFRGRGYIQLTGKYNYIEFGKSINENLVENPDLVSTKYPLLSAAWFFQRCLTKCDLGSSRDAIIAVTKCVNGGLNGLNDRIKYFNKFYELLK
jgi:putative chitinase